jgi:hypothetical protein
VTVKVISFLQILWQSVRPMLAQMISSGYGALSILTSSISPLIEKVNLFYEDLHMMKFLNLAESYLGLSSQMMFLARLESRVTKYTGLCSDF